MRSKEDALVEFQWPRNWEQYTPAEQLLFINGVLEGFKVMHWVNRAESLLAISRVAAEQERLLEVLKH